MSDLKDAYDEAVRLLFMVGLTAIVVLVLVKSAHCTDKQCWLPEGCKNSIGSTSYTVNPNVYLAVDGIAGENDVDGNLNLRVHPRGTYMLYEDTVLICGHPREAFEGIGIPFLLTYRRQASRSVRGVGCHDLVDVSNIISKEIK
jgi:hypothetical protein